MSRLAEMQTRYKQKQLQEKEDKLKKLLVHPDQQITSSIHATKTTVSSSQRITTQQRYGAQETRQQKAGIDRSYPLKPLKASQANVKVTTTTTKSSRGSLNAASPLRRKSDFGGDDLVNENNSRDIISTGNIGNGQNAREAVPKRKELRPVLDELDVGRTPPPHSVGKKPLRSVNGRQGVEKVVTSTPNPVPRPRVERSKAPSVEAKVSPSPTVRASPQRQGVGIKEVHSSAVNDNLDECKNCGRRFLPDRLAVHEKICTKTSKKKRKTYDALKHRVQGTELEPFAKKPPKTKAKSAPTKKYNWKQTHEEFINAIRAAKQAQAHLAKGGKLSDLPPPPPSSNPDYVQCPNCGRKFNESAAARHIPKCANYSFNKPKAAPGVKVTPSNKTRAMR